MSSFICGVHVDGGTPVAFALFEPLTNGAAPRYALRMLREIDGAEALATALASEPQYAGRVAVATTGGSASVEALHAAASATAYAVTPRLGADGETVSAQQLADTFERLFRDGAVLTPSSSELATAAFEVLHQAADLSAASDDSDRDADGDLDDGVPGSAVHTLDGAAYDGDGAVFGSLQDVSRAVARTGREVEIPHPAAAAVAIALWHAESTRSAVENPPERADR